MLNTALLNMDGFHLVNQCNEKTEDHPLVDVGFVLDLKPTLMTLDFLASIFLWASSVHWSVSRAH